MDITGSVGRLQLSAPKNARDRVFGVRCWLQWLAHFPKLNARARLAALELVCYESMPNGQAYPSLETLARDLGCSVSAARASIRQLEDAGIIKSKPRFRGREQISNEYLILRRPAHHAAVAVLGEFFAQMGGEGRAIASPPVAIVEPPPSRSHEGKQQIQVREMNAEKSNSTRTREGLAKCGATPRRAAAASSCTLPSEIVRRFDEKQVASLATAVASPECAERPDLIALALGQLTRAADVLNPAGYFLRVFRAELAASADAPVIVEAPPPPKPARKPPPPAKVEPRSAQGHVGRSFFDDLPSALVARFSGVDLMDLAVAARRAECLQHPVAAQRALAAVASMTELQKPADEFMRIFRELQRLDLIGQRIRMADETPGEAAFELTVRLHAERRQLVQELRPVLGYDPQGEDEEPWMRTTSPILDFSEERIAFLDGASTSTKERPSSRRCA